MNAASTLVMKRSASGGTGLVQYSRQRSVKRVPGTVYGYTLLATAQALGGHKTAAADTIASMCQAHPRFTITMFRRHEPYRDAVPLNRIVDQLHAAGKPL